MPQKEVVDVKKAIADAGLLERVPANLRSVLPGIGQQVAKEITAWRRQGELYMLGDDYYPPLDLYNIVSAAFPVMDAEGQAAGYEAILHQCDQVKYCYAQDNHAHYIKEPLLLARIGLAHRRLYWPGMDEAKKLIADNKTWRKFKNKHLDEDGLFKGPICSDFVVAYGLLRADFCDWGNKYAEAANPDFLKRVVEGISLLRFGGAKDDAAIEKGRARLKELLPGQLHEQAEKYVHASYTPTP